MTASVHYETDYCKAEVINTRSMVTEQGTVGVETKKKSVCIVHVEVVTESVYVVKMFNFNAL